MSIFFDKIFDNIVYNYIEKRVITTKPVIAIPQMGNDLFRKYMKSKYVNSLERAGALVRWIELDDVEKASRQALDCDGLLLPGGADVNPVMYGEEKSEKCGKPNETRDKAEPKILQKFIDAEKPVLAICRGIQILNVTMDGTLFQDIKAEQKCKHMDFLSRARSIHSVSVEKDSVLYGILKTETAMVNSMHHQAINKIGENLKVAAKSEDGYVEALELENHPFCVGVQWHPEHMSKKSAEQRKIFTAFVEACKNR